MNRRSFFTKLGLAAVSLAILPAATTYARNWKKAQDLWVPNPAWVDAPYEVTWVAGVDMQAPLFDEAFLPMRFTRGVDNNLYLVPPLIPA